MDKRLQAVAELTAENRHTTALYLAARHFGLSDLCAEFRRIFKRQRLERDLSDGLSAQRYAAFNELRRRVLTSHGADAWRDVRL